MKLSELVKRIENGFNPRYPWSGVENGQIIRTYTISLSDKELQELKAVALKFHKQDWIVDY
ncbi:hypothetical protein A2Z67_05060 [Candidatus Woesebacteria bacterium RBG_13_36_22]|uniref:Uncharacterized protein n=1 Tax=Candidatus Woesebacteria bacterium RBG_13_36_22 TaxID=1802478 RepID=A0A1F7X2T0_9BACT|nr:MAG: hypothetical protein A2Z67_05060 [Candidatus Woesebacteria bacterium RBG_13_36_22]